MSFFDSFYSLLVRHYDKVFPHDRTWTGFVAAFFPDLAGKILDAGCGTGGLACDLAGKGYGVTAVDGSRAMVRAARRKSPGRKNPVFLRDDMVRFVSSRRDILFDGAVCFGNTLVHLRPDEARKFVRESFRILRPGGRLLLQILHYDRICSQRPAELPVLEAGGVRLTRTYDYPADGRILFGIRLFADGRTRSARLVLYPLKKKELESLLIDAGFGTISWYGGFDRSPLKEDSFVLIAVAEKPGRVNA